MIRRDMKSLFKRLYCLVDLFSFVVENTERIVVRRRLFLDYPFLKQRNRFMRPSCFVIGLNQFLYRWLKLRI